MKTILIVEDEMAISRVISAYLKKEGFHIELAFNGIEALKQFEQCKPSLVLLDVMLPEMDGWKVLDQIREKSACPVIMLTARGDIHDRLTGLNEGADDYMTKPFVPEEVVARVHAVLRRSVMLMEQRGGTFFGSLYIDFKARRVLLKGAEVSLTPRDLSVLLFLANSPNQIFTREQLIENIWGLDYEGSDRAVDLAIKRLRQALKNWPDTEGEIRTIRGMGYQFSVKD